MRRIVWIFAGLWLLFGVLPCKALARQTKAYVKDGKWVLSNAKNNSRGIQAPTQYEPYIREASQKHNLDPRLIKAIIKQESDYNTQNISRAGAQGLMQLMPGTAKNLGVSNSLNPYENIHGGTKYLKMMMVNFNGDLTKALAAYNAGPEAVKKYGRVPPYKETQNYVRSVLKYYDQYRGGRLTTYQDAKGQLVFTDDPYSPE